MAPVHRPPSIQKTSQGGKVEILVTEADGVKFDGPNDLTFGPDGRLYFTDSGDWNQADKPHPGRICVIEKDGTAHILEELDYVYPNGIVAEPDGSIVWVESYTLNVIRRKPDEAQYHVSLGLALKHKGDLDGAITEYRQASRLDPESAEAQNACAWLWATCPEPRYRDGKKAVEAAASLGRKQPAAPIAKSAK